MPRVPTSSPASTAVPQPPSTSQNVPRASAPRRAAEGGRRRGRRTLRGHGRQHKAARARRRCSDILRSNPINGRQSGGPSAWPRSSTRTPTKHRCWPRTRSSRSSRRTPRPPASTSRPATSPWPAASSPCSATTSPRSSRSATPWPSWATWPRRPRPTSSSCPTSAPRSRSSRPRSPSSSRRATPSPTTRRAPRPTRRRTSAPATTRSRAAPSTRCCARATPTAGRRRRSRTTPARTRTRWGSGAATRAPTSRRWAPTTSAPTRSPSSSSPTARSPSSTWPTTAPSRCCKDAFPVLAGEVVDSTVMRAAALDAFLAAQIARAKDEGVLFSVHLKATMMKVSDPIIFGHVVKAFLPAVFEQYGDDLAAAGLSASDGLGSILAGLDELSNGAEIKAAIEQGLADGPPLAMVDSDRGITNLHVPSDVIVDASMPAMIRTSGHMWGPDGKEADTLAVIPDSSYAGIYQAVIDDCRANGAFDPTTMGSVPNVGLMAQAAEEYGSHDKTFEIEARRHGAGRRRLRRGAAGAQRQPGRHVAGVPDEGRADPQLGRARRHPGPRLRRRRRCSGSTPSRAHDANLIAKVEQYLGRARHRRPADRDHVAGRRVRLLARAHPPRRGHHLGHRQRAARLQHRPVPDPRARHQRQDALDRPAHQRRRPVRDRRRRLGPQARPAAASRRTTCAGTASASSSRWPPASTTWPRRPTTRAPSSSATPSTAPPERSWPRTSRPAARPARSTTGAATSTSRSTGRRSSPRRPRTPSWRRRSPRSPATSPPTSRRSPTSCSPCRARRSTSAATTGPTTPRRPTSCARPRRSTRCSAKLG